jgi:AcrR family transcriptional regulator
MVQTRRERLRETTVEEIKVVARRQMGEQGGANLSLRAIAAEMGMSAPALYRYFDSRDELVTALIVDAYNSLADFMIASTSQIAADAYGKLFLAKCLAFREWGLANREQFFLIFGTPIPGYHAPAEITTPAAWRSNSQFMQILDDAWKVGRITIPAEYQGLSSPLHLKLVEMFKQRGYAMPAPLIHIAMAGWGIIQGMVSLELYGQMDYFGEPATALYQLECIAYLKRLGLET